MTTITKQQTQEAMADYAAKCQTLYAALDGIRLQLNDLAEVWQTVYGGRAVNHIPAGDFPYPDFDFLTAAVERAMNGIDAAEGNRHTVELPEAPTTTKIA